MENWRVYPLRLHAGSSPRCGGSELPWCERDTVHFGEVLLFAKPASAACTLPPEGGPGLELRQSPPLELCTRDS